MCGLDTPQHFQVEVKRQVGMKSANHVDFRCACLIGFSNLVQDLVQRQGIAPIFLFALAERAERAPIDAYICVIDMAVDSYNFV